MGKESIFGQQVIDTKETGSNFLNMALEQIFSLTETNTLVSTGMASPGVGVSTTGLQEQCMKGISTKV